MSTKPLTAMKPSSNEIPKPAAGAAVVLVGTREGMFVLNAPPRLCDAVICALSGGRSAR
jgi:hypothetical protein